MSSEPHSGQRTLSASRTVPFPRGPGGAMPYSSSAERPRSLIQSVVQAGARTVRTRTSAKPASRKAMVRSSLIESIAGQPE